MCMHNCVEGGRGLFMKTLPLIDDGASPPPPKSTSPPVRSGARPFGCCPAAPPTLVSQLRGRGTAEAQVAPAKRELLLPVLPPGCDPRMLDPAQSATVEACSSIRARASVPDIILRRCTALQELIDYYT